MTIVHVFQGLSVEPDSNSEICECLLSGICQIHGRTSKVSSLSFLINVWVVAQSPALWHHVKTNIESTD
jgi:hypothetical protein